MSKDKEDKGYNGWSNYETWLVNLHFEEILRDCIQDYLEQWLTHSDYDDFFPAKKIRQIVEDVVYEIPPFQSREPFDTFVRDVMTTFLQSVDWHELQQHYRELD